MPHHVSGRWCWCSRRRCVTRTRTICWYLCRRIRAARVLLWASSPRLLTTHHYALIFAVYPIFFSPRHDTLFEWWMGGYRLRLPRLGGCGTLSTPDSERTSTYAPFIGRLPYTYLHTQIITVRDENVQTSQAFDKDFWLGEQRFSNTGRPVRRFDEMFLQQAGML